MLAVDDVGERDVGALREDRVIFQERPETREIVGVDVVDPEDRVRIAHADGGWRMQQRRIDRPDLQLDVAGVAKLLGERNVLPAEFRRPHVDGVEVGRRPLPAVQRPRRGLESDRALACLFEQAAHDAAHAVAAGAGFRPVIIVDADEGLGAVEPRPLQHHKLVIGHMRRHRARVFRRDLAGRIAQIDHDNLVADAIHLGEGVVGEPTHQNIQFVFALYGE